MQIWKFFRRYGWQYLLGIVFLIINTYLMVYPARLLGRAIDLLRLPVVDEQTLGRTLWTMIGVGLAIFATRAIWRTLITGCGRLLELHLRRDLFDHLQRLSVEYFHHQKTGNLMAYAINDINAIRQTFGQGMALGMRSLFTGLFAIGSMTSGIHAGLAGWSLLPVPAALCAIWLMGRESRQRFRRVQEAFAAVSDRVQENISGIRVIKAYAQEENEEQRFEPLNERMVQTNMAMARVSGSIEPMTRLAFGVSFTISLIYGSVLVRQGTITPGDFVTFNGYLALIVNPVQAVARLTNILQRGLASLKRYNAVMAVPPEIENPKVNLHPLPLQGGLTVRNLSFRYPGSERDTLSNLSFTLRPGHTLGILGHTGSGKTTLCNLLLRLYNPQRGAICYDGVDLLDIDLDILREGIGYVPQDNFLFSASIAENIAFYAPGAGREQVEQAARDAGIYENIMDFPQGFETQVGERGMSLSGGQKQRISIARALVKRPALLILDDSLSAVDTHTEQEIWRNLRRILAEGASGIIVAHRISTLMGCDEILVLEEGRIVERGTHEELLAQGGIYAQAAQKQSARARGEDEQGGAAI